ncbi:Uncharacterised protein [Escherichia coli]|nr:Uncharacterised protein [Escherichia coli]
MGAHVHGLDIGLDPEGKPELPSDRIGATFCYDLNPPEIAGLERNGGFLKLISVSLIHLTVGVLTSGLFLTTQVRLR